MRHPIAVSRLFSLVLAGIINYSAQAGNNSWILKWELPKAFIENKSQFDNHNLLGGSQILFGIDQGPVQVYFTKAGLTYRFDKKERKSEKEEREKYKNEKDFLRHAQEEGESNVQTDWIHLQWANANPDVEVTGLEQTEDYHSYNLGKENINFIRGFRKLLYKNLYPGIDAEYVFHEMEGIKYSLIVHPGADPSVIQMKYSDVKNISIDEKGNLLLPLIFGNITEHAPLTFYSGSKNSVIKSEFILKGKTVSFRLGNYNRTKTIIIDPWTVFPSMPNSNKVWEIESDGNGNAYIYGGDYPCKLQKYNTAGALQWTYSTAGWDSTSWIGTLLTDTAGNSYVTIGSVAAIQKVNTSGSQVWIANGGFLDEYWSLALNCDYTQLIAGGTRLVGFPIPNGNGVAFNINLNSGNIISNVVVAHAIPSFIINDINEIRSICASPDGNYYFHTLDTVGCLTQSMTINYRLLTSYSFSYGSPNYGFTPQPQHVIRATGNYVYTMNGATLFRRDISNGTVINSVSIPGGGYATPPLIQGIAPYNNGIAIDSCGFVYVGSQSQVHKFDPALNLISSSPTTSAVYDVAIGKNGEILVCGNGFASAINMSACNAPQVICANVLTAAISQTNVLCYGDCNGTATAIPSGGAAPYTYLWSNGQTTQTATGLCALTYSVTITDAALQTFSASVIITQPAVLAVSILVNNPACAGGTGSLTANPSGGTPAFSYLWGGGQTTQTISVLTAGNFIVTVTDSNGCSVTDTASVSIPTALTVSISSTPATCGSSNGTATATPAGGTPGYSYLWSNGQTTQTAVNLGAGTYTVTVTDTNNCTQIQTINVSSTNAPVLTASQTNPGCFGDCTGSASVTATGGTVPYTYLWSSGQTVNSISGLCAGNYTVTVTDSSNCSSVQTVVISQPSEILLSVVLSGPILCNGDSGSITVTATGGVPAYSYLWSSGQTTQTVFGLAGIYTITVTDSNGCTKTTTAALTEPSAINVTASFIPATCGSANGSATANASGGVTPYAYLWSNGQTTQTAAGLATGIYTVTVTDLNGCSQSQTVNVTSSNAPVLAPAQSNVQCNGGCDGSASVSATGGTAPYSYLWSTGQTTTAVSNLCAGNYTVTVTDNSGCSTLQNYVITEPPAISANTSSTPADCITNNGTAGVSSSGGTFPHSFLWSNGQTSQTILGLGPGTYTVTITDGNGCTKVQSVTVSGTPGPTASAGNNVSIYPGDSTLLIATGGITFAWNPSAGLSCTSCPNPVASPGSTTLYCVTVTDSAGCQDSACVLVTVIEDFICGEVFVPSAFSPNSDGQNDLECVFGTCIETLRFEIFDRWGEKVFETSDTEICWDGLHKGKQMNTGIYVYQLFAVLTNGNKVEMKGNITLMR